MRSSETSHERCSPSIKSTVTNWRVGETIRLGRDRTLRVVGIVVSNQNEPSVLIVEQGEAAVRDLFAMLDRVRPEGLRYASTRVADSSTFVILLEPADGSEDPGRRSPNTRCSWSRSRAGWTDRR